MKEKLKSIADSENLKYDDKSLDIVTGIAKGDLRKAINLMQSSSINISDTESYLNANLCYNVAGYPLPDEIEKITNILIDPTKNLETSIKKIHKIVLSNGY